MLFIFDCTKIVLEFFVRITFVLCSIFFGLKFSILVISKVLFIVSERAIASRDSFRTFCGNNLCILWYFL